MLIKVIDTKGRQRWINAAYIKALKASGSMTEIEVAGWTSKVRVAQELDEVAAAINMAMPDYGAPIGADAAQNQGQAGSQAAVIGMVLGG